MPKKGLAKAWKPLEDLKNTKGASEGEVDAWMYEYYSYRKLSHLGPLLCDQLPKDTSVQRCKDIADQ